MASGFGAIIARMNYITRWGLMRNSRSESLSEHSLMTATTAHLLACAARDIFGASEVSPERTACCALYHDAAEILTGDMPTPVKYANERLRTEYKAVESEAERRLVAMLPEPLRASVGAALKGDALNERERRIIKAADKLAALIKCIEEKGNGNTEFENARRSTLALLSADPLPETRYFIDEFLPAYSLTLDELLTD